MVTGTASAAAVPVGYHFSPNDEELLEYYLAKKVRGEALPSNVIPEVDLYGNEAPWEMFPRNAGAGKDRFVVFTRLKRLSNKTVSRTASIGEWHGNTSGAPIFDGKHKEIGTRRQYTFKVKKGKEAESGRWIMHEFSLAGVDTDVVLCEIVNKEEGCLSSSSSSSDLPLRPSTGQFVEQISNQHEGKEVVNGFLCCERLSLAEVENSRVNGFANLPEDDFWGDDQFGLKCS